MKQARRIWRNAEGFWLMVLVTTPLFLWLGFMPLSGDVVVGLGMCWLMALWAVLYAGAQPYQTAAED